MAWLDGFFENSFLKIVRQNSSGALVVNGSTVTLAEYTWSQMVALSGAQIAALGGIYVNCTDRHSHTSLIGGSLWKVDVVAQKFVLISEPIIFTNLSDAPSPITYPGLKIRALNIGLGGSVLTSDGTNYRTDDPYVVLYSTDGVDIERTTSLSTEYQFAPVRIYRDINGDSLLQNKDCLEVRVMSMNKTGTADKLSRIYRMGRLNTTSDASIFAASTNGAVTDKTRYDFLMAVQRLSNTSVRVRGPAQGTPGSGGGDVTHAAAVTVDAIDHASEDTYFNLGGYLTLTGSTDTKVTLADYEVRYVRGY